MKKRFFEVDIVIKKHMLVVADDESDALEVSTDYLFAFIDDTFGDDQIANPDNVKEVTDEPAYQGQIPYGVDDEDPKRDWTIADWRRGFKE